MRNLKSFSRTVRKELSRISLIIKQIEFKVTRFKGFLKRKLRKEIQELRRMRDNIMHRLSELTAETRLHLPTMQSIRDDIALLQERCHQLKMEHVRRVK